MWAAQSCGPAVGVAACPHHLGHHGSRSSRQKALSTEQALSAVNSLELGLPLHSGARGHPHAASAAPLLCLPPARPMALSPSCLQPNSHTWSSCSSLRPLPSCCPPGGSGLQHSLSSSSWSGGSSGLIWSPPERHLCTVPVPHPSLCPARHLEGSCDLPMATG